MKIIAESPDEDILLQEIEKTIKEKGYSNVFTETFTQSFLGQIVNNELSNVHADSVKDWSPSHRLWFYDACKEFFNSSKFEKVKEEYINLFGIYDLLAEEERDALKDAKNDFALFQDIKKSCSILHVDNYKKLKTYLDNSIVKGKDSDIKIISAYYDESLSQYVIEVNSIKIPFTYRKGEIQEEFIIYGWSNFDSNYSYEFLKPELLVKDTREDTLEDKIAKASVKKIKNLRENKICDLQERG